MGRDDLELRDNIKPIYETLYASQSWDFWKNVDFKAIGETSKSAKIDISADCDFNFGKNNTTRLEKALRKNTKSQELLHRALYMLNECSRKYHQICNFSLIPMTGNLNDGKRHCDGDRFDNYIYHLGKQIDFIKERKETFIKLYEENFKGTPIGLEKPLKAYAGKGTNKIMLVHFLLSFNDIFDYCNKMYLIDDLSLVEDLLESGKKETLESTEDIINYMNLAFSYWSNREQLLYEHNVDVDGINKTLL